MEVPGSLSGASKVFVYYFGNPEPETLIVRTISVAAHHAGVEQVESLKEATAVLACIHDAPDGGRLSLAALTRLVELQRAARLLELRFACLLQSGFLDGDLSQAAKQQVEQFLEQSSVVTVYDDAESLEMAAFNVLSELGRPERRAKPAARRQVSKESSRKPTKAAARVAGSASAEASSTSTSPITAPSSPPLTAPPSIRMVADRAVEEAKEDLLDYSDYAAALDGLISHPRTSTPLIIAVNAPWGAGKSSLSNLLKARLTAPAAESGHPPHHVCEVNAWRYDDEETLAPTLMRKVAQAIDAKRSWWSRLWSPLPLYLVDREDRGRARLLRLGLILLVGLLMALPSIWVAWRVLGIQAADLRALAPEALLTVAGPTGFLSLLVLGWRKWQEFGQAVAAYARDPGGEVEEGSLERVRSELRRMVRGICADGQKLVVFVDDLERCKPPRAVDVLEVVNQLLDHRGIVVVLSADMAGVAAHVEVKYADFAARFRPDDLVRLSDEESSGAYGRHFLQKIVQVQLDLPALSAPAMETYLGRLAGLSEEASPPPPRGWGRVKDWTERATAEARRRFDLPLMVQTGYAVATASLALGASGFLLVSLAFLAPSLLAKAGLSHLRTPNPADPETFVASLALLVGGFNVLAFVRDVAADRRRKRVIGLEQALSRVPVRSGDAVNAIAQQARSIGLSDEQFDAVRQRATLLQLGDDAADFRLAWQAGMPWVPRLPRSGKRFLNRTRLWLYLAHLRDLHMREPRVTPQQVGRWAALHERWPEVGQVLVRRPEACAGLEELAGELAPESPGKEAGDETGLTPFGRRMHALVRMYASDDDLRRFFAQAPALSPVLHKLTMFHDDAVAEGKGRRGSHGREAVAAPATGGAGEVLAS